MKVDDNKINLIIKMKPNLGGMESDPTFRDSVEGKERGKKRRDTSRKDKGKKERGKRNKFLNEEEEPVDGVGGLLGSEKKDSAGEDDDGGKDEFSNEAKDEEYKYGGEAPWMKPEITRENVAEYYRQGEQYFDRTNRGRWIKIIKYDENGNEVKIAMGEGEKDESGESWSLENLLENIGNYKTKEEEKMVTRAATHHTIHKVKNYYDLIPEDKLEKVTSKGKRFPKITNEESNEQLRKLTRELWKKFAVHGIIKFDKEGKAYISQETDLDGKGFLKMLELSGFDTSDVKFVAPGNIRRGAFTGDSAGLEGVVSLEGGESLVDDHHALESDRFNSSSATQKAYEMLIDMGLLERQEYLDKFVKFVSDEDNKNYSGAELKELFDREHRKFSKTIMGMCRYLSTETLLELFKNKKVKSHKDVLPEEVLEKYKNVDPDTKEEKMLKEISAKVEGMMGQSERAIKKMRKAGFEIDSGDEKDRRFGKVLIDTGVEKTKGEEGIMNKVSLGFEAVRANGYGAYVIWIPEQNRFKVFTDHPMDFDFSQGVKVRQRMWTKSGVEELSITLEEIISKLCGKEVKIEGKLKKALDKEQEEKEKGKLAKAESVAEGILNGSEKMISPEQLAEFKEFLEEAEGFWNELEEKFNWEEGGYGDEHKRAALELHTKVYIGKLLREASDIFKGDEGNISKKIIEELLKQKNG